MKIKIIIFIIVFPQILLAQYKSLFTQTKVSNWSIFSNSIPGITQSYKITIDTFVNGKQWKYFGKNTSNSGLLREDTISGKVWFKGINPSKYLLTDTAEKLVCDFSLHVGDSFHYYYHQWYGTTKYFDGDYWLKVDSVFYFNGLKHIRFDTANGGSELIFQNFDSTKTIVKFYMIEGFGTNKGFHYMFNILNHWVVQCEYRDSNLFYMSSFSTYPNNCNVTIIVGISETKNNNEINIYPNPVTNELHIETNSTGKLIAQIFDITGKQIGESISFTNSTSINTSSLSQGIYFLRILELNTGLIRNQKVVINKN